MPELPEVETITRGLKGAIVGKKIKTIEILEKRSFPDLTLIQEVKGKPITNVSRRGKSILIEACNMVFFTHLKMTGQLVYNGEKERSTRVVLWFEDNTWVVFNDQRKFGYLWLMKKEDLSKVPFLRTLGPEPLEASFRAEVLAERLRRRLNTSIKAALLDQKVLAGIGNIYADESLFLSGIHPARLVKSLSNEEISKLYESLIHVLKLSISLRGSSRQNYTDLTGRRGDYLDQAFVYERRGKVCRKCLGLISKCVVAGRGTHFCAHCQQVTMEIPIEKVRVSQDFLSRGRLRKKSKPIIGCFKGKEIIVHSGIHSLYKSYLKGDTSVNVEIGDEINKISNVPLEKVKIISEREYRKKMRENQSEELLKQLKHYQEVLWLNDRTTDSNPITVEEIIDASDRLERFRPFFMKEFPETRKFEGLIESDLIELNNIKIPYAQRLFVKCDHTLPIAGSIKARGGIYEILSIAERLAVEHGLLKEGMDYEVFSTPEFRELFQKYTIEVATTGNLGLSIGIMSRHLGFQVKVHMSFDAKTWKKELLREHGATVIEYKDDYSKAVEEGRKASESNPFSIFIDDEKSLDLFLGYAVAAYRLKESLPPGKPLYVAIPCGVGGAPGGIAYALKLFFKERVEVFFAEPTHAPCMLLGMMTGKHDEISVKDIGLDGVTLADGLAVGKPSSLVGKLMMSKLSGVFTVSDEKMMKFVRTIYEKENLKIEPSAAAGFFLPEMLRKEGNYLIWTTGGSLVPEEQFQSYLKGEL